ncbi:MAG: RidA family protein [Phycisphaerae bacterium]
MRRTTITPEQKIDQLGLTLPEPTQPVGSYVPAVCSGSLLMTAGQIPMDKGKLVAAGKVPDRVTVEQARQAAIQCLMNALSAAKAELGQLGRIRRILRINVFVASGHGFTDQALVANAASDLLTAIFADAGKHTRCAIGAAELPLNASVELDLTAEITSR